MGYIVLVKICEALDEAAAELDTTVGADTVHYFSFSERAPPW